MCFEVYDLFIIIIISLNPFIHTAMSDLARFGGGHSVTGIGYAPGVFSDQANFLNQELGGGRGGWHSASRYSNPIYSNGQLQMPVSQDARWAPFFGPAPYPWKQNAQQMYDRETQDLPEAYKGENVYLKDVIIAQIENMPQWPIREVAPLKKNETSMEIMWDRLYFNHHLLGRTPEEGVSRLLSYRQMSGRSMMVRWGIALLLEHGFMKTPQGRLVFTMQIVQIVNAYSETMCLGAMEALRNAPPYEDPNTPYLAAAMSAPGAPIGMSPKRHLFKLLQAETAQWAEVQKAPGRWRDVYNRLNKVLKERSSNNAQDGNYTIIPTDMVPIIAQGIESAKYMPGATLLSEKDKMSGLGTIRESRVFHIGEHKPARNPLLQEQVIGGFMTCLDHHLGGSGTSDPRSCHNSGPGGYRTSHMNFMYYSEDTDGFHWFNYADNFKYAGLFKWNTPGKPLTSIGQRYFGSIRTWGELAEKTGGEDFLNQLVDDIHTLPDEGYFEFFKQFGGKFTTTIQNQAEPVRNIINDELDAGVGTVDIQAGRNETINELNQWAASNQPTAPTPNFEQQKAEAKAQATAQATQRPKNVQGPMIIDPSRIDRWRLLRDRAYHEQGVRKVTNEQYVTQLKEIVGSGQFSAAQAQDHLLYIERDVARSRSSPTPPPTSVSDWHKYARLAFDNKRFVQLRDFDSFFDILTQYTVLCLIDDADNIDIPEQLPHGWRSDDFAHFQFNAILSVVYSRLLQSQDGVENDNLTWKQVLPKFSKQSHAHLIRWLQTHGDHVQFDDLLLTQTRLHEFIVTLAPLVRKQLLRGDDEDDSSSTTTDQQDLNAVSKLLHKSAATFQGGMSFSTNADVPSSRLAFHTASLVDDPEAPTYSWREAARTIDALLNELRTSSNKNGGDRVQGRQGHAWMRHVVDSLRSMRADLIHAYVALEHFTRQSNPQPTRSMQATFDALIQVCFILLSVDWGVDRVKIGITKAGTFLECIVAASVNAKGPAIVPADVKRVLNEFTNLDLAQFEANAQDTKTHSQVPLLVALESVSDRLETNRVQLDLNALLVDVDRPVPDLQPLVSNILQPEPTLRAQQQLHGPESASAGAAAASTAPPVRKRLPKDVLKGFLLRSCTFESTGGRFMDFCFQHNIRTLIHLVIFRPNARYMMATMIHMRAFGECANTWIGHNDMQLGDNVAQKMMYGHFTCYFKTVVHDTSKLVLGYNVLCTDYNGGNGHEIYNPLDRNDREAYRKGYLVKDMFVCAVPRGWKPPFNGGWAMDITGRWSQRLTKACSLSNVDYHYPSAPIYSEIWGWQSVYSDLAYESKFKSTPDSGNGASYGGAASIQYNTLVLQQHQFLYNPGSGNYDFVVKEQTHWGSRIYEGVAQDRKRGWIQPVDYHHKAVFAIAA